MMSESINGKHPLVMTRKTLGAVLQIRITNYFSFVRMYVRAVWLEGANEEEGVIPESWVGKDVIYWPPGANAKKAFEKCLLPASTWRQFPLIKIKFRSGMCC